MVYPVQYDFNQDLKVPSGAELSNDYYQAFNNQQNAQANGYKLQEDRMEMAAKQRQMQMLGQFGQALQSGDPNAALNYSLMLNPDKAPQILADAPTKAQDLSDKVQADVVPLARQFLAITDPAQRQQFLAANLPLLQSYDAHFPGLFATAKALYNDPTNPVLLGRVAQLAQHGYTQDAFDKNSIDAANAQTALIGATNKVGPPGSVVYGPGGAQTPAAPAAGATPTNAPAGVAALHPAVAQIESHSQDFKNGAPVVSSAGAKYQMQVMPATAAQPGHGIAPAANDSPQEYDRVGNQLLDALYNKYQGDPQKTLAAYNWGEGNVDKMVARYGNNWFSAVQAHRPGVAEYVNKGLALAGANAPTQVAQNTAAPTAPVVQASLPTNGAANVAGDLGPANTQPAPTVSAGVPGIAQLQQASANAMTQPWGVKAGNPVSTHLASPEEVAAATGGRIGATGQVDAKGSYKPISQGFDKTTLLESNPNLAWNRALDLVSKGIFQAPAMGSRDTAARNQVYLQGQIDKAMNMMGLSGADAAVRQAQYKGQAKTIASLNEQVGSMSGAVNALDANLNQFEQTARKLPLYGSVTVNGLLNGARREFGDPRLAALAVSAATSSVEAAKTMIASASGGGRVSDSMRTEFNTIMDPNQPPAARLAALRQMSIDSHNMLDGRVQALKDQTDAMYKMPNGTDVRSLAQHGSAPHQAQSNQQPTVVRTGIQKSTGRRVVQYSDGTIKVQ